MNSLRLVLLLSLFLAVVKAFAPLPLLTTSSSSAAAKVAPLLQLDACRTNAKKEKIKRNRENMRKFKVGGGKKGLSRRKMLKKNLSSRARAIEAEFIAKCFIYVAPPATSADDEDGSEDSSAKN